MKHLKILLFVRLTFLLIASFLSILFIYCHNIIPDTENLSAYEFFSSFMPAEDFIEGENGSLVWKPSWGTGQTREIKFCNELVFPNEVTSEKYPYVKKPKQHTYSILLPSQFVNTLRLPFEIYDKQGSQLFPSAQFRASKFSEIETQKNELCFTKVYLIKFLDGAWYCVYNDEADPAQYAVILSCMLFGNDHRRDMDIGYDPLPTGRYALALCDADLILYNFEETRNCYALLEFDLVCEYRHEQYLQWVLAEDGTQKHSGLHYWEMPINYRVSAVGETLYQDPYASTAA